MQMPKEIVVRIHGGLGNIMFEYALGRYLSIKYGSPLSFDVSLCKTNPLGDYSLALEAFHIDIEKHLVSSGTLKRFEHYRRRHGRRWFLYNMLFADADRYVAERYFHFDPTILEKQPPLYLAGWWQSEKYFKGIRSTLIDDFTVRAPLEGRNKEVADHMRSTNSVSIHIRRLDYVTNAHTRSYHGELSKRYYEEAIARIQTLVPEPTFFVFSDDIPSVKGAFSFPEGTTYIDWNGDLPHEDIRLMSLCKHNIIANSTLGWWGAWLNQNEKKTVIAPAQWFAEGSTKNDDRDIVPSEWLRVPSYFFQY